MSIAITGLSKQIDKVPILTDIDLCVNKGEVLGLLGPNGAGKTTLMKIIIGALPFEKGCVEVCGVNVGDSPALISGCIGYLPEHNPLYDDLYVREYLLFVAGLHGLSGRSATVRVSALIDMVGLGREARKKISQLSKGYRQRVGLAQAMMGNPEVLILDEPTTGLDPNQLEDIRLLVKQLGKDRTVILSTHILQEVKEMCTRAVVLSEGRIVADLPNVADLQYTDAAGLQLILEFKYPVKMGELIKVEGIKHILDMQRQNAYQVSLEKDVREQIFEFAVRQQNPLLGMRLLNRTLENIFREKTKL